jgi:hypothetical protein
VAEHVDADLRGGVVVRLSLIFRWIRFPEVNGAVGKYEARVGAWRRLNTKEHKD